MADSGRTVDTVDHLRRRSFRSKGHHGIHARGAARGQICRECSNCGECQCGRDNGKRVGRIQLEQETRNLVGGEPCDRD